MDKCDNNDNNIAELLCKKEEESGDYFSKFHFLRYFKNVFPTIGNFLRHNVNTKYK